MKIKKILLNFKRALVQIIVDVRNYIKRLLFPLYFFPLKITTYTIYYLIKFVIKLLFGLVRLTFRAIIWPFRSWKNFAKSILWSLIFFYIVFNEVRFSYVTERYGGYFKFFCSERATTRNLKNSVVRVVGGLAEGSGFFVANNQVLTSFHVIADEPSPKIVFPDGSFTTPIQITGNKDADLALLYLDNRYDNMVLDFGSSLTLSPNEPLLAAGYPWGTDLPGEGTITKGIFNSLRGSEDSVFVQTNIDLVEGMSGGPLVDACGEVVGINTLGLSGLFFFVSSDSIQSLWPTFTDVDIAKIEVDPSSSPADAVYAYYTYLKARRMQDGYNLLSSAYLQKTNFEEWTSRFSDILDVQVYLSEAVAGRADTVFVKFSTKNWVGGYVEHHFYEGTWQTIFEDGVYKMNRSNIKEVAEPSWEWFYES